MKLKSIQFEEGLPKTINVDLTIDEAAWIAKLAGLSKHGDVNEQMYYCLVGDIFNRYWDNGVDDVIKKNNIKTPPIIYDDQL